MLHALVALIAGVALTFAFAPFHYSILAPFALLVLFLLWQNSKRQKPLLDAWLFALGHFSSGLYWVYISLYYFGGAPLPFAILANLLLILFLSLYPVLVAWLMQRFSTVNTWHRALIIPLLWTGGELVRAYLFSGFPWLSVGYSMLHTPLDAVAPIGGVFLISFILTLTVSLIAADGIRLKSRLRPLIACAIFLIASATNFLTFTQPSGEPFSVALIQGNIPQSTKFDPILMERHLQDYIALAIAREESVIILPETAFTFMEEQLKPDLEQLNQYFSLRKQTLVTGIPAGDLKKDIYYNAVIALGNGSGHYYKHHLLPFGEYVPLRNLLTIFEKYVDIPYSNFERGDAKQPPLLTNNYKAGVSICYEAAFGRDMRHALPEADYLINISNDAWFKDSIAADQHLQMNQMRARELGREMARATNDGITVLLDATGHIKASIPRFERTVLSGSIQPYSGLTPYARYGNAIICTLLILYAVLLAICTRRNPINKITP
ncbi:MAG: apolipoprotein N-acyltransferase [Cardiobacteriaceae bacterium]|nr:apolipoprotein N-acyltransferase [Cardiobacteriaceae bacterium]